MEPIILIVIDGLHGRAGLRLHDPGHRVRVTHDQHRTAVRRRIREESVQGGGIAGIVDPHGDYGGFRQNVYSLIWSFRRISATGVPTSACRGAIATCSSVN